MEEMNEMEEMDETGYFWDTAKLYVTDGNGKLRSQDEPPLSKAYERALEDGWLHEDDEGNLRLVGDEEDVEPEWDKSREPLLVDLYDFEVKPARAKGMKPYRSGSMTQRSYYWKPTGVIKEEIIKKLGREPEVGELAEALEKEHRYINRSEGGRKNEVAIAQAIYNNGLTPFIGDDVWKKRLEKPEPKEGETTEEWQLRLKEWKKQKALEDSFEQTDLYVAGVPVECKRLGKLENWSKVIGGELYVFVCSASSFYNKPEGLRYHLLSFWSVKSNVELKKKSGLSYVSAVSPAVVPVERVDLWERDWINQQGWTEQGIFVKATDLISFNSFIGELNKHRREMSKTSRKLEDIEVVRLFYPHLDQQEHQQKLEQEHARLLRHQQKLNDDFDF